MKALSNYPVNFPFGATTDPYSPANPHLGDDHAAPQGTPIDVNGVTIGLVGSTGFSTGNHCHIGRFVNGMATNPHGEGFHFNNAVVTEINEDAKNGKYVRVQADGASWVYLHMSDNKIVKVGQQLKEEDVEPADYRVNDGDIENVFVNLLGRKPNDQDLGVYRGKTFKELIYAVMGSDEFKQHQSGGVNKDSALKYVQDNLK